MQPVHPMLKGLRFAGCPLSCSSRVGVLGAGVDVAIRRGPARGSRTTPKREVGADEEPDEEPEEPPAAPASSAWTGDRGREARGWALT